MKSKKEKIYEGTIKYWDFSRSYGFIGCDDFDSDAFLHSSKIAGELQGFEGAKVQFTVEETQKGLAATWAKILGAAE